MAGVLAFGTQNTIKTGPGLLSLAGTAANTGVSGGPTGAVRRKAGTN